MRKKILFAFLLALATIFVLPIFFSGCSSRFASAKNNTSEAGTTPPIANPVQSNAEGAVTVVVTWEGVKAGKLSFSVVMDTHSVDLDGYDLKVLATLTDAEGKQLSPLSWIAPAGGHHRSGQLVFSTPESLVQGKDGVYELRLRDIAGVPERVLTWKIN
ncbi:MAG: hypothetical protein Q8O43_10145 [Dehalococcoidia bacterium]|nr:hypothetical protein [Dehalococcoidia bacterium]